MLGRGSHPKMGTLLTIVANKENNDYETIGKGNTAPACKGPKASDTDPDIIRYQAEPSTNGDAAELPTCTTIHDGTSDEDYANEFDKSASISVNKAVGNEERHEASSEVHVDIGHADEDGKDGAETSEDKVNEEEPEETNPDQINDNGARVVEGGDRTDHDATDTDGDARLEVPEAGIADEDGDNPGTEVQSSSQMQHPPLDYSNAVIREDEDEEDDDDEGDDREKDEDFGDGDDGDDEEDEAKEDEEEDAKATSSTTSTMDTGMSGAPTSKALLTSEAELTGSLEGNVLEGACGVTSLAPQALPRKGQTPVTVQVENAFAVQVGNGNVLTYGAQKSENGTSASSADQSGSESANVAVYINNCDVVQVGDHNRINIRKVTPQENAFVRVCCELDIDPEKADDIHKRLSHDDVRRQFAKRMAESFNVTCKIRAATRGCILLELEVPTEEDRLQLLRMARDGTFQQVLLETFLPEFAAEGRVVKMNLAIGVRNPSQDMVEELQGAVASSSTEKVEVVTIPAVMTNGASTPEPHPDEAESSKQPENDIELVDESPDEGQRDVPVEEGPGVDSPGVDSQGVDSPGVNSPGVDSPGVDSPGLNSPGVDSPGLNSPGVDSPGLNSPGVDSPGLNSPGVDSPGLNSPGVDSPGLNSPGVDSPGLNSPGVDSPGLNSPGVDSPGLNSPGADRNIPASNTVDISQLTSLLRILSEPGEGTGDDGPHFETADEAPDPDNQRLEQDDQRLEQDDQRLQTDDQPLQTDDQPLTPDDQPLAPDDQPLAPDDQPPAPEDQQLVPDDQLLAPDDQPLEPDDQRLEPDDQSFEHSVGYVSMAEAHHEEPSDVTSSKVFETSKNKGTGDDETTRILSRLAITLDRSEWKQVAQALRVQQPDKDLSADDTQLRMRILREWQEGPFYREQFDKLLLALKACGRDDFAVELLQSAPCTTFYGPQASARELTHSEVSSTSFIAPVFKQPRKPKKTPEVDPRTPLRKMPYSLMKKVAMELDPPGLMVNWKDLAAHAGYSMQEIGVFEMGYLKLGGSPTTALLQAWGSRNATVQNLETALRRIGLLNVADMLSQEKSDDESV